MQQSYQTFRLIIKPVDISDSDFLLELMNTPEWIKFIGDRNLRTIEAIENFIKNLKANPKINYWVVSDKSSKTPIGIVSFIKRDFLEHWDIGFAFHSKFTRQGFATEATRVILTEMANEGQHSTILASVLKENANSIKLLEKLGFEFSQENKVENEILQLYSISVKKILRAPL